MSPFRKFPLEQRNKMPEKDIQSLNIAASSFNMEEVNSDEDIEYSPAFTKRELVLPSEKKP